MEFEVWLTIGLIAIYQKGNNMIIIHPNILLLTYQSHKVVYWVLCCTLYVNDIGNSCTGNILSFADDTSLYISDSRLDCLYTEANRQINGLYDWFCSNRLSLNAKKTKYIVIRPKHMRQDLTHLFIYINNPPLDRVGTIVQKSLPILRYDY